MYNQKLENINKIDLELLEIGNIKLNEIQNELLPTLFNFVIIELNNLENLINDPEFLKEKFRFNKFRFNIFYDIELGFYLYDSFKYEKIELIKSNPKTVFCNYYFYDFKIENGYKYELLKDLKSFVDYIEFIKKDYIKNYFELMKLEKDILKVVE